MVVKLAGGLRWFARTPSPRRARNHWPPAVFGWSTLISDVTNKGDYSCSRNFHRPYRIFAHCVFDWDGHEFNLGHEPSVTIVVKDPHGCVCSTAIQQHRLTGRGLRRANWSWKAPCK